MVDAEISLEACSNFIEPSEVELTKTTLFEKILSKTHLPYKLGATLLALFIGPLGNFLFLFSVSHDINIAFYSTFVSMNAGEAGFPQGSWFNWYSLIGNLTWYSFLFYVAFSIRYLQLTLTRLEPKFAALTLSEGKYLTGIFNLAHHPIPQLAITIIFLFIYGTSVPNLVSKGELTILSTPVFISRSLLRSIMFGSILWLFFASLWSLYRFGKTCPRFKSFLEDPMLGVGVLGTASFSLSKVYFIGLSIFAVQMVLGEMVGHTTIVNFIVMLVLIPMGVALFLAPLISTHKRMIEVKNNEINSIREQFAYGINHFINQNQNENGALSRLLILESLEKRAASISTWPIENPVTGQFVAIIISVISIILSRYVQIFLNI